MVASTRCEERRKHLQQASQTVLYVKFNDYDSRELLRACLQKHFPKDNWKHAPIDRYPNALLKGKDSPFFGTESFCNGKELEAKYHVPFAEYTDIVESREKRRKRKLIDRRAHASNKKQRFRGNESVNYDDILNRFEKASIVAKSEKKYVLVQLEGSATHETSEAV